MKDFTEFRSTLAQLDGYVYALCEILEEKRIPFYIGKGKGDRCLQHLKEVNTSDKNERILSLMQNNALGIDILRHGIKDETTLKMIEATCIDLIGVGELTNRVRGHGTNLGRMTLDEIHQLITQKTIPVRKEHSGLAFILNNTYKSGMTPLNLFECTRGVWAKVPRDKAIKFAYATYNDIVKEVYEIHSWVEAGTQQYFTRSPEDVYLKGRWEFIGRIANEEIRKLYIGNVIEKKRSYSSPFVRVG